MGVKFLVPPNPLQEAFGMSQTPPLNAREITVSARGPLVLEFRRRSHLRALRARGVTPMLIV